MKYQSNISRLHFVCSTTQTVRDKITLTMRLPIPPLSNVHLMSARTVQECLFTTLLITQPLIVFYVVAPHGSFEPNTAGRSRSVLNRIILAAKRGIPMGMRKHSFRKRQRQASNLQAIFFMTHQFSKLRRYNHFGTLAKREPPLHYGSHDL